MDYLVFRLYGPLASWGEVAVGEARHTVAYPTKSALIGLLGAALGIRRDDEEQQFALANGYLFATKVLASGSLMRDYHTTQVPDSAGKRVYRTRRDELVMGKDRLGTVLSGREYRCDSHLLVAVRVLQDEPVSLSALKAALLRPRFQLSLGRKSCVLSAPLAPQLIQANSLREAFDQFQPPPLLINSSIEKRWLRPEPVQYCWEGSCSALTGSEQLEGAQQLTRHDMPLSRRRWQFQPRQEWFWQEGDR